MRILLTRPADQALETAKLLEELGHQAVVAPLTEIHYRSGTDIDPARFTTIAVTSGRAVDALVKHPAFAELSQLPLYCVGDKTAAHAQAGGFGNVFSAGGNVDALSHKLIAQTSQNKGRLLYGAGADRAGDLSGALKGAGIQHELVVLYDTSFIDRFPQTVIEEIRHGQIDAALVYSKRGAEALMEAFKNDGLEKAARRIIFFALSQGVAHPLSAWVEVKVVVAAQPNEPALLGLL
ncbi:MAG: uroporphyrinogen-III synthase [Stappiaceae bacterium]